MRTSLARAARAGVVLASLFCLGACAAQYGYGSYGYGYGPYGYGYGYAPAYAAYSGPYYAGGVGIVGFGGPYHHDYHSHGFARVQHFAHLGHGFHFAGHSGSGHSFSGHPAFATHTGRAHSGDHNHV